MATTDRDVDEGLGAHNQFALSEDRGSVPLYTCTGFGGNEAS